MHELIDDNNATFKQPYRQSLQEYQLVRIEEVSAITTMAKSSINLWVAQGKFPKPIALSPTIKVWLLRDVVGWINTHADKQQESA